MRILLIEDDPHVATGVQRALVDDGFEVVQAGDGRRGLELARHGDWDLIVLDLMLPGLNGYRICRTLREEGDWTPILMLTAKSGEYDEAEGLETGADDFLTKPFSMVVLGARVRALLRRPGREALPLRSAELAIDPVGRRCVVEGEPVPLTARELEVLSFLLARAPAVVAKDELLTGVWGGDFAGDPNIVEVYVSHLRRKLDPPLGRPSIETVRGAGYRLDVEPVPR